MLVVPDTEHSVKCPMIVGTNVLRHVQSCVGSQTLPMKWQGVMSSMTNTLSHHVKAFTKKPIMVMSNEMRIITGVVCCIDDFTTGMTCLDTRSHGINVSSHVVKVDPNTSFSKIPVCICNLSAKPLHILPKSLLCILQEVEVVRHADPFEGTPAKSHNASKSLEELGIHIPTGTLDADQ